MQLYEEMEVQKVLFKISHITNDRIKSKLRSISILGFVTMLSYVVLVKPDSGDTELIKIYLENKTMLINQHSNLLPGQIFKITYVHFILSLLTTYK